MTLRSIARQWIDDKPALYLPLTRRLGRRSGLTARTRIVIEGFPRCGNSFAEAAFRLSQPAPLAIAHHTHAPATILAAARRGLPAIVVYRHPDDAVVSARMFHPHMSLHALYRMYEHFYQKLAPVRDRCVLSGFERTTTRFGEVIQQVNTRCGTNFTPFAHEENAAIDAAFEEVDRLARKRVNKITQYGNLRSRDYAAARDQRKQQLKEAIAAPALTAVRARARAIFEQLDTLEREQMQRERCKRIE